MKDLSVLNLTHPRNTIMAVVVTIVLVPLIGNWTELTLRHYFSFIIPHRSLSLKYFVSDYSIIFLRLLSAMLVINFFFAWRHRRVAWVYVYLLDLIIPLIFILASLLISFNFEYQSASGHVMGKPSLSVILLSIPGNTVIHGLVYFLLAKWHHLEKTFEQEIKTDIFKLSDPINTVLATIFTLLISIPIFVVVFVLSNAFLELYFFVTARFYGVWASTFDFIDILVPSTATFFGGLFGRLAEFTFIQDLIFIKSNFISFLAAFISIMAVFRSSHKFFEWLNRKVNWIYVYLIILIISLILISFGDDQEYMRLKRFFIVITFWWTWLHWTTTLKRSTNLSR